MITQLSGLIDDVFNFAGGENIGQGFGLRRLDDIDPLSLFVEDMLVEKLQSIAVDFDGAPGVALDECVEIRFEVIDAQAVGAAVKKNR